MFNVLLFKRSLTILLLCLISINLFLFIKVIKFDWNLSHKSYATYFSSFNWISYKTEIFYNKLVNSIRSKNSHLPIVKIYLEEKLQNQLLSDTPTSTKKWVKGHFYYDGFYRNVSLRHIGDNPANWYFEKKSWRVKTSKKELIRRNRYFDFVSPQSDNILKEYLGFKVAEKIGLTTPKARLVELHVNDLNFGAYIEKEKLNELFLRRNKFMPVNIYKGEPYNNEKPIGIDLNLFSNSGIWKKNAIFNQFNQDDNSDLIYFLDLLNEANINIDNLDELYERASFDEWAKYGAYQILTNNYHSDNFHNQRIIIDPWSGYILPIIHDPDFLPNYIGNYEYSTNDIMKLFNSDSKFIFRKYEILNNLIRKKILTNIASETKKEVKKIEGSELMDSYGIHMKHVNSSIKKIFSFDIDQKNKMLNFIEDIKRYEDKIISDFNRNTNSSYELTKNGFKIHIHDFLPISNILIKNVDSIETNVVLDTNFNNIVDDKDIRFHNFNNEIRIPISLFSNRIGKVNNYNKLINTDISINPTEFNFLLENSDLTNLDINYENIYTNQKYQLHAKTNNSEIAHKFNRPIFLENYKDKTKTLVFSNDNFINENLIIEEEVKILPGTRFFLKKGVSIIFKNKINAIAYEKNQIQFLRAKPNQEPWGTIAIFGKKTSKSKISNWYIEGGSGANIDKIQYTGMFSLHNTENIKIKNLKLENNSLYDDTLHLVYCKEIDLINLNILNARFDAIDIDTSEKIRLINVNIFNAGNDGIDFMESQALVSDSIIKSAKDKGISVGENSNILVFRSEFLENNIANAAKDGSKINILLTKFIRNNIIFSSYAKNYQYNSGGYIDSYYSLFSDNKDLIEIDKSSEINIFNSNFDNENHYEHNLSKNVNFLNKDINYYQKIKIENFFYKTIQDSFIKSINPNSSNLIK